MQPTVIKTIAGFLAGFIAVLVFHQTMYLLIQQAGLPLRGAPWAMAAEPSAFGMPRVINQAFWGGLWGIAYAFLVDYIPGNQGWLKGLIFGMIFPMLLGSWVVVAMIKGQPMFSGAFAKGGFDIWALRNGFLLNGIAFGLGLGLLYPLIAGLIPGHERVRG